MDNWSPNTMLKYGFAQVDERGRVVSIWNFPDFEEALEDVDIEDGSPAEGNNDGDSSAQLASATAEALPTEVGEKIVGAMSTMYAGPHLDIEDCAISQEFRITGPDHVPGMDLYDDLPQLESEEITRQDVSTGVQNLHQSRASDLDMAVIDMAVVRIALVFLASSCQLSKNRGAIFHEAEKDLLIHMLTHSMDGLLGT
ncbi:hypothetical protein M758_UG197300 [Ceratodon purpureus]|nr:hypothetical protein M758_UG197300 [Ceratodon purpureus]